jgi:CheY-like chemotaxis protein
VTSTCKTVLVVGEDPVAQGNLAELLVRAGYGLMQTTSGSDVLRLALHYRPDVILLNLTLGGTSTLEVLHALQADAQARRIPIVGLSASAWPLLSPEAKGKCVIFRTPLKPRRLLAHLAKLVGEASVPSACVSRCGWTVSRENWRPRGRATPLGHQHQRACAAVTAQRTVSVPEVGRDYDGQRRVARAGRPAR